MNLNTADEVEGMEKNSERVRMTKLGDYLMEEG